MHAPRISENLGTYLPTYADILSSINKKRSTKLLEWTSRNCRQNFFEVKNFNTNTPFTRGVHANRLQVEKSNKGIGRYVDFSVIRI